MDQPPLLMEPPVGERSPVRYGLAGPVYWTLYADIVLLSLIHVGKDGIGGFNDAARLSWEQICEQLRADMFRANDPNVYTPNEIKRRWEEDLREPVRVCAEKYWTNNVWGVNEEGLSGDVRVLRDLLHHTFLGGRSALGGAPLSWPGIAEAMNRAKQAGAFNTNFNGYTPGFISEYYYYHLCPRLVVVLREGLYEGRWGDLEPRGKAPFPRIAYPEILGLE